MEFQDLFERCVTFFEMVGDKIFLVMSSLYFFNQLRIIQVVFNDVFHPVLVPNFTIVFPFRAATT